MHFSKLKKQLLEALSWQTVVISANQSASPSPLAEDDAAVSFCDGVVFQRKTFLSNSIQLERCVHTTHSTNVIYLNQKYSNYFGLLLKYNFSLILYVEVNPSSSLKHCDGVCKLQKIW